MSPVATTGAPETRSASTTSSSPSPPSFSSFVATPEALAELKRHYDDEGYVVIRRFLSGPAVAPLLEACEACIERTRRGKWPHRRIVGKRFPPYEAFAGALPGQPDVWGVQHLLHPQLAAGQPDADGRDDRSDAGQSKTHAFSPFAHFYSDEALLSVCSALLGAPSYRSLQMELFNLLCHPQRHRFALGWHRDDVRADVGRQEEEARLRAPTCGVQWNVALRSDDCLFVVPGSHRRARDEAETKANLATPPDAVRLADQDDDGNGGGGGRKEDERVVDGAWDVDPATTLRVSLQPGDAVFYSQRILHRASYLPSKPRATLHGCYGALSSGEQGSTGSVGNGNGGGGGGVGVEVGARREDEARRLMLLERARNVLQHDVSWMRDEAYGASLPERLRPMWANLVRMEAEARAAEARGETLGYSLDG